MDKKEALKIVKKPGCELQNLPTHFKKNKEIVLEAIKKNKFSFSYAHISLKKDKRFVINVLKMAKDHNSSQMEAILEFTDKSLQKDKEVVLEAVKASYGFALEFADKSLKKDKEIVLAAVKHSQYGQPLEYADERLRKDKKFISELVRLNPSVIVYIHDSLTKDKKFLLDLLKIDSFFLLFHVEIDKRFNYLLKDKEFMLKTIKHNIDALGYADNTLRKDKNFLLEVLKQNRDAIIHFDNSLVADKKFVLSAVKQGSDILPDCTQACYENEEINLAAQKITKKRIATLSKKKNDNKVNKYGMTELEGAKEEMFKLKYFLSEIKKKKK